jgi:hypothetical protein
MGIAKHNPASAPSVKVNIPKIEPTSYQGLVTDDKVTAVKSLIAYVEGAPWTVDYFSQVVAEHNDLREVDAAEPDIYQQYTKIHNFEIRVTTPLTESNDTTTGFMSVTGSGNVYGSVLPNVNDYFTSDAGDKKMGLFRVTNTERKSFNRDSVFYMDYVMVGYTDSTAIADLVASLGNKVTREFFFRKDRLIDGLQPLLKAEENQKLLNVSDAYVTIVRDYFKQFFSIKHGTLVLPGQEVSIYDTFIVGYLTQIVDSQDAPELKELRELPNEREYYMSQNQFWKAMVERDFDLLSYGNTRMGLISKKILTRNSYLHGFALSSIQQLVYPVQPDETTFGTYDVLPKTVDATLLIKETKSRQGSLASLITDSYVTATASIPVIHPVLIDDYYVLSAAFYNNTASKSVLEILTKDYLQGNALDMDMLQKLIDKYRSWSRLEQFYYGPILLTLLKETSISLYS